MQEETILAKWSGLSKTRQLTIVLVGCVGLFLVLIIFRAMMTNLGVSHGGVGMSQNMVARDAVSESSFSNPVLSSKVGYDGGAYVTEMVPSMVLRPASDTYTTGDDAESYESLSYNASIKKADIEGTCDTVEAWKPLGYIVFEVSDRNDTQCSYRFKVKREYAEGVLTEIRKLDPEYLTENTETVKKQLVEYDDRLAILLKKEEILRNTLENTSQAYADLKALATQAQDVDALTKIISNEIRDIGNLTNERLAISQEIERLSKAKSELEDRVGYVSFYLSVTKYDIFNTDTIKDSWVSELRTFFYTANGLLQSLSIGFLSFLLNVILVVVYLGVIIFTILFVGKHAWRGGREYWKR